MRFFAHCWIGLLTAAAPAAAGVLLTVQVETGRNGVQRTHEIRIEGRRVRMDTPSDAHKRATLYDDEAPSLFVVDEERKTFRRIDPREAERRLAQFKERQEQVLSGMEERIRDLPPEKQIAIRKWLNRGMAAGNASRMECQRVAEGEAVGSWSTDHYECFIGSRKVREVWTVPWEETGLTAEEVEALRAFTQRQSGGSITGVPDAGGAVWSLAVDAHPGLAVRGLRIEGGVVRQGHEISKLADEDFESDIFFVDGSYTEASAGEFPLPVR